MTRNIIHMYLRILLGLLIVALVVYICIEQMTVHDTFNNHSCDGPCKFKGERRCCQCPQCAWFIDRTYNGRCIRRGTGPDSCLNNRNTHFYPGISVAQPVIVQPWYHPGRWFYSGQRPVRGPGWVKDRWGRWIRSASGTRRFRRRGRRHGRRFHHL